MSRFLLAASKAASAASAAVVPQPSFSFADIVEEVRELRTVTAALREDKSLLESQVALLSQQLCLAPSERTVTEALPAVGAAAANGSATAAAAPASSNGADRASAFHALRAELATNLDVDPESASASQQGALAEQLHSARRQADLEASSRLVVCACLAAELRSTETVAEWSRLEALVTLEGVRARSKELEMALHAQAADAQRATQAAVAAARAHAHGRTVELEDALAAAQESLA